MLTYLLWIAFQETAALSVKIGYVQQVKNNIKKTASEMKGFAEKALQATS